MANMAAGEVRAVGDGGFWSWEGTELPSRPFRCSVKHSEAQSRLGTDVVFNFLSSTQNYMLISAPPQKNEVFRNVNRPRQSRNTDIALRYH